MAGEVSFQLRDGYISSCTWTSNDFCSEEKYRAFADDLYVLFDSEPEVEDYSYGNGNTYRYYWTDSYYDLDVTMAHGFFAYDPDGKIEIKWEAPEGTIEESEGIAEKDIKMVENIFSLSHQEIILEHSDVYGDSKNLYMEGEFAGVSGTYSICLDDGQVWRVVFKPDERGENQDKIIDTIIDFLGEYKEYDSKWNSYTWETNTLEIEFYAEENIYFDWIGEDLEVNNEDNTEEDADLEIGVVENVHTAADIPDALMNDEFKSIVDLFSKGYSDSGLDVSDAETYDDGETNIFYLEGIEFLGEEPEDGYFSPRIIYSKDAINNNGTPEMIYLAFSYPRKSNGYEETVEKVEDIAKALGISDDGLIDNDYSSSSKWATGEYATFTFSNLNLKLTVSNMQSSVEIEIVPID